MFENISISGWRQFENINIDFHKKLTILTGANASGKTTILRILSQHFGWDLQLIRPPANDKFISTKTLKAITDFWKKDQKLFNTDNFVLIGKIKYSTGQICEIRIPSNNNVSYNTRLDQRIPIPGLFIPSHRPIPIYKSVDQIPLRLQTKKQAYQNYFHEVMHRYQIGRSNAEPPSFRLKQSLISLAMFGYGNEAVQRNQEAVDTFEEFQQILKKVLPPKIGFQQLSIRLPEVILETKSGDFSLDSMSGGIASIIDFAWQIYMFSEEDGPYVVIIDEPENHLHPELQRMLLPNLMDAFPNVQFIVATHNPFIIGSTRDSNIYVLDYNENNKVYSQLLDTANRSGTSNEILRNVLGLDDTLPIWVSEKLDKIVEKYLELDLSNENIEEMRKELEENGLDNVITQAIIRVIGKGEE